MKVCIIQPLYSADWNDSEKLFKWELDIMDKCDESMDLIVLPESTDVPAYAKTFEQHRESYRRYNKSNRNIGPYCCIWSTCSIPQQHI